MLMETNDCHLVGYRFLSNVTVSSIIYLISKQGYQFRNIAWNKTLGLHSQELNHLFSALEIYFSSVRILQELLAKLGLNDFYDWLTRVVSFSSMEGKMKEPAVQ